jgi:hypothetical protein
MLPLYLFRNDIFTTAICITSLASMVMMALVVLVPLFYQLVVGLSAQQSGARLIALTLGNVIGGYLAGQALSRTDRYRFLPLLGTSPFSLVVKSRGGFRHGCDVWCIVFRCTGRRGDGVAGWAFVLAGLT